MTTRYTIVLAITDSGLIGIDCPKYTTLPRPQIIPWDMPDDLKNFRAITSAHQSTALSTALIMGRKTYDTIAPRFTKSVFPGRVPIVVSNTVKFDPIHPEVIFVDSVNPDFLAQYDIVHNIGGAHLINTTYDQLKYNDIHLTRVNHDCNLITQSMNPMRVDMVRWNQLLTLYQQSSDAPKQFHGTCSVCAAPITADYHHYILKSE